MGANHVRERGVSYISYVLILLCPHSVLMCTENVSQESQLGWSSQGPAESERPANVSTIRGCSGGGHVLQYHDGQFLLVQAPSLQYRSQEWSARADAQWTTRPGGTHPLEWAHRVQCEALWNVASSRSWYRQRSMDERQDGQRCQSYYVKNENKIKIYTKCMKITGVLDILVESLQHAHYISFIQSLISIF